MLHSRRVYNAVKCLSSLCNHGCDYPSIVSSGKKCHRVFNNATANQDLVLFLS